MHELASFQMTDHYNIGESFNIVPITFAIKNIHENLKPMNQNPKAILWHAFAGSQNFFGSVDCIGIGKWKLFGSAFPVNRHFSIESGQ